MSRSAYLSSSSTAWSMGGRGAPTGGVVSFPSTMFGHAVRRLCVGAMRTRAYSSRPKVLLMDDILLAKTDLERLSAHADILVRTPL